MNEPSSPLPRDLTDWSQPIDYMARTRAYYQALGYGAPYRWAQYEDVPFTPLAKPLSASTIGIVTTAAPFQPDKGDQGPGAPYNGSAKFYDVYSMPIDPEPDLRIAHVAIDRAHTTAEDQSSYFPLRALSSLARDGMIAGIGARFHGLPTNRSQSTTLSVDAPELVSRVSEDGSDAILLVANCPVCHQSIGIAARGLEAAGIPTVILGSARDIVENVGVPRFLFSDFPLGNAAGPPKNTTAQRQTAVLALELLASAQGPRATAHSPVTWPGAKDWKRDYANADLLTEAEIQARRRAFDQGKAEAHCGRLTGGYFWSRTDWASALP
ncbi:MAG: glycine reductase [Pseudomonadota bacterium]